MGRKTHERQVVRVVGFPWHDPEGLIEAIRSLSIRVGPSAASRQILALGKDTTGLGICCYSTRPINGDTEMPAGITIAESIRGISQQNGSRALTATNGIIEDPETDSVVSSLVSALHGVWDPQVVMMTDCNIEFAVQDFLRSRSAQTASTAS